MCHYVYNSIYLCIYHKYTIIFIIMCFTYITLFIYIYIYHAIYHNVCHYIYIYNTIYIQTYHYIYHCKSLYIMVKSFSIVYIYNHLLCVIHVDMKMNSNHRCENEVINKSPGIFSRKVTKNKKHENGDVVMDMSLLICLRLVCSWLGRIGTSTIWSLQISNPQRNRSLKVTSAHVCSTFCAVKKCDRCRSNNPQEMLVDCPTWHFSPNTQTSKCPAVRFWKKLGY